MPEGIQKSAFKKHLHRPLTGEEIQLRIFEKRYQWLMRQAVEQGGCFAIQSANGLATTARVSRCVFCYVCELRKMLS